MEKNPTLLRITQILGDTILNTNRFGHSSLWSVWVESGSIQEVGKILKFDPDLSLDWLENLSVFEMDQALILSYFLRSAKTQHQLVLRVSCLLPEPEEGKDGPIFLPSVDEIWPMCLGFEDEIAEMFGIYFGDSAQLQRQRKSLDWLGFPLRKKFVLSKDIGLLGG